jgi:S-formylglutathione hydrolase
VADATPYTVVSRWRCFGGEQLVIEHVSDVCGGVPMRFGLFLPPASEAPPPVVWFLSGLTCTWENVTTKGGFQRVAAELGVAVIAPDTSPRGDGVPDEPGRYDLGQGAGFYLNATREPWAQHFNMYEYVAAELPAFVGAHFAVDLQRQSVTGHSMGGHGALVLALRNPGRYRAVSAFSPIVAPSEVQWGQDAFTAYLGEDRAAWAQYDATALIEAGARFGGTIFISQGAADNFLEKQLRPERFERACQAAGQPVRVELAEGYDHSYYFIATFMEEHLRHHADS